MAVNIALPLFGTPGQELGEGTTAKVKLLRELSTEIGRRLERAAQLVEQLEAAGWTAQVAVHDILFSHPKVQTEAETRRRFQELGLDAEQFVIMEELSDEEAA